MIRETELYPPVKRFLEANGYDVKAEVNGCDVVASNAEAMTLIVELKTAFSLELVLQGVDRQTLSDDVYLAVLRPDTTPKRRNWRKKQRSIKGLCRRLGLGLMLVDPLGGAGREIDVLLDPAPYRPRKNARKQARLQREFRERTGDPNTAGATRVKIVTTYRQDAIRCAMTLNGGKVLGVSEIRAGTNVARAGSILQKNHYGWFERERRGVYRLSEEGAAALVDYADVVRELADVPADGPP